MLMRIIEAIGKIIDKFNQSIKGVFAGVIIFLIGCAVYYILKYLTAGIILCALGFILAVLGIVFYILYNISNWVDKKIIIKVELDRIESWNQM